MRICHVITTLDRGGAEKHLLELAGDQVRSGSEVFVLGLKGNGELVEAFEEAGVKCMNLAMDSYVTWSGLRNVARWFSEIQPTLIHAHLPPAEVFAFIGRLLSGCRAPLVVSKHNDEIFLKTPLFRVLGQIIARSSSEVICISRAVSERMTREGLVSKSATTKVIHYGIPSVNLSTTEMTRSSYRDRHRIPRDALVFGTASRLVPQKRVDVLISAFQRLTVAVSEGAHLVIVGRGPLEPELRALAKRLDVATRVHFLGQAASLTDFYGAIDVFCLSSEYEGFGLVLIEAMSHSLPIIASHASAIPEVVAHEHTGILCPVNDPAAFASAMIRLRDVTLRNSMGAAGRLRVRTHFSPAQMFDAHREVYLRATQTGGLSLTAN